MSQSRRAKLIRQKVASFAKLFQCAICLEILEDPVTTKCNHNFCKQCCLTYINRKPFVACPICKGVITKRGTYQNDQLAAIAAAVRNLIESYKLDTGTEVTPRKEHSFSQACRLETMSKESGSLSHTLPNATSRKGNRRSQMVQIKRPRDPSKVKHSGHKRVIEVEDDSNTDGIAIKETVQAEANQHVTEKGIISPETHSDFDYHIQNNNRGVCTSTSNARETCMQSTQATQTCLDHINDDGDVVMLASPNSTNLSKDSKLSWSSWVANHSSRRKTTKVNCIKTYSKKDMIRQTKAKEDSMSSKEKVENWFRHSKDNVIASSLQMSPDKQGVKNTLKRSDMPIKLKNHTSASRLHGLVNQENSPPPSKHKGEAKTPNNKRVLNDIKNSPNVKRRRGLEDLNDPYRFISSQESKKPAKKTCFTRDIRKRGAGSAIKNLMQEIVLPLSFSSQCTSKSTQSLKANSVYNELMINFSKGTSQQEGSVDEDKPQDRSMRIKDSYDKNGKASFTDYPKFTVSKAAQIDNNGVVDSGAADSYCTPVFKVGHNPNIFMVTKQREIGQYAKQHREKGGDKIFEFPERASDQVDDDDDELFVTPLFMVSKPTAPSKSIHQKIRKEKRNTGHLKENQDKIEVFKEDSAAAENYDLEVELRGLGKKSKREESIAFVHSWETDAVCEEHEASLSVFNTAKETHQHGDFISSSVSIGSSNWETINFPHSGISKVASSKTKQIKGNLQNTDLSRTRKESIRIDQLAECSKEDSSQHLGTKDVATNTQDDASENNYGTRFHKSIQQVPAEMQSNVKNAAELDTETAAENYRSDTRDFFFTRKKASSARKPGAEDGLLETGEQEGSRESNLLGDRPTNAAKHSEGYRDENSSNTRTLEKNSRNKEELGLMETENQKSNFPSALEANYHKDSGSDKLQVFSEDNTRLRVMDLVEPVARGKEIRENRNYTFSEKAVLETPSRLIQNTGTGFIQTLRKTFDLAAETQDLEALNFSNNQNTLDMLNDLGLVSQPCQEAEESRDANEMCMTLDLNMSATHKPICLPVRKTESGSRGLCRVHKVCQTVAEIKSHGGHMGNMQTLICPSCNCIMSIKIICIGSEVSSTEYSKPVPNSSKEVLKVNKATNTAVERAEQLVSLKCDKVTNKEASEHGSTNEGMYTEAVHSIGVDTNTKAVHSIDEGTNTKSVRSIDEGANTEAIHSIDEGTNTEAVRTNSTVTQTEYYLRGTHFHLDRDHTKGTAKADKSTMTDSAYKSVKQPISVIGYSHTGEGETNMEVSTPMLCLDVLHTVTKAITVLTLTNDASSVSTQGYEECADLENTQPYIPATKGMRAEVFDDAKSTDSQTSENRFGASCNEKARGAPMLDEIGSEVIQMYSGCAISSPVAREDLAETPDATTFADAELTAAADTSVSQNNSIPIHDDKAESAEVSASCNGDVISIQSNESLSILKPPAAIPVDIRTVLHCSPAPCLEADDPDQDKCSNIFQSQTASACDEVITCNISSEEDDNSAISEKGNEADSEYEIGLFQTYYTDAGNFQNDGCKCTPDAVISNVPYIKITHRQHINQRESGAISPRRYELNDDWHSSKDLNNQQHGTRGNKNANSASNLFNADLSKEGGQDNTDEVKIIGIQNEQDQELSLSPGTLQTVKQTNDAEIKSESQETDENSPEELFPSKRRRSSCRPLQYSDSTEEAEDKSLGNKNSGNLSYKAADIHNHTFDLVSPSDPDLLFAQSLVAPLRNLTSIPLNPKKQGPKDGNMPNEGNESSLASCNPQFESASSSFGHMPAFCRNDDGHHGKPLSDSDDENSTDEFFDPFLPKERDRIEKLRRSFVRSKADLSGVAGAARSPVSEELQKAALVKDLGLFGDPDDESDNENVSHGSLLTNAQHNGTDSTDGDCRETQMQEEIAEMRAKIRAMEQQLRYSTRNTVVDNIPCMVHQEPQPTEMEVSNEEYDSSNDGFSMAIAPTPPSSSRPLAQAYPANAVRSKSSDFKRTFR